jgi:hypothetical protein
MVDWSPPGIAADASLAVEWVEWPSLQSILRGPTRDDSARLAAVSRVFSEMARRHRVAMEFGDPWLAHVAATTRHILVGDGMVCRVDFESPLRDRPVVDLLAREVVKLCRWAACDWGPDKLPYITKRLLAYHASLPDVLETAVRRNYGRSPSLWRRLRNAPMWRRSVQEVTEDDVVRAIVASLDIRVDAEDNQSWAGHTRATAGGLRSPSLSSPSTSSR